MIFKAKAAAHPATIPAKRLCARSRGIRTPSTIVGATCGAQELLVRAPGRVRLTPGRQIGLRWADTDVHIFDAAEGSRLDDARPLSIAA